MTNKKQRAKTAKVLRQQFDLKFIESQKLVKAYQKYYGCAPTHAYQLFGLLVKVGALKVVSRKYLDNSWYNEGYSDRDIISYVFEDKKGNQYSCSYGVPGAWGIDW